MGPDQVFELKRQGFHFTLGVVISFAVWFLKPQYGDLVIAPLALGIIIMLIIPRISKELHLSNRLLYHFEREEDKKRFPYKGAINYGLGVIPPILFLPTHIACAAIITLSVGDALSTVVGRSYGRHRIGQKSIEGFLAFIIPATLSALYFVSPKTAIILALVGGTIELISPIDDNLAIPWGLTILYHLTRI